MDDSDPSTASELMEFSTMISIDECGVMYEEAVDFEEAEFEFAELTNYTLTEMEQMNRKRMQGDLSSSDIQEPIGDTTTGELSGSDQSVGCFTYVSGSPDTYDQNEGPWEGFSGSQYYYDHICTGTLISPWHVLTSGHCCHPPGGHNFYSNWVYYPQIAFYDDIYGYSYGGKSRKVKQAHVYNQWRHSGHINWNFCILELWYPIFPHIHPYGHYAHFTL
eukprot:TRINITY_DN1191_c0_g1_i2.p1 TRINITY_DN1191_c0_g1~~TRINITY_DN1191_c0_g1_i2.p1  ORF type:complete len:219 (-),score=5.43 TRINITY_DN1191_c0_g1_i2:105-761(-)